MKTPTPLPASLEDLTTLAMYEAVNALGWRKMFEKTRNRHCRKFQRARERKIVRCANQVIEQTK